MHVHMHVPIPLYMLGGREQQFKGTVKLCVRLTCGYGEIPQFCLLEHLAEVCTYSLLSAPGPRLHQNPQSQLKRNREIKVGHVE
jgi:hypothetical protein